MVSLKMSFAPPAKRPEAHQFPTPEAKRPKIDDYYLDDDDLDSLFSVSPTGVQDDSLRRKYIPDYDFEKGLSYCLICGDMVDHVLLECPDKAKGSGIYCFVCEAGPCKRSNDEHHIKNHMETIMFCNICGCQAKHWSDNCPYRDEYDDASDPENHLVSTESAKVSSCFYD